MPTQPCEANRQATMRAAFSIAAIACLVAGCASQTDFVTVKGASSNPFTSSLNALPDGGSKPSERTTQLLRRYNLEDRYRRETDAVAAYISEASTVETQHEHQFAIAELEYLAGKREESGNPPEAISHYATSVLHAYRYLFDERHGVACNPYDPQFRGACDLYNQSLEGLMRLVSKSGAIRPGERRKIQTANHHCSFDVELHSSGWHAEDVDAFEFVSDYQVAGLRNHYRTYGLGVPLIAVRREGHGDHPAEAYYPSGLTFPLTAFLRINNVHAGDDDGDQGDAPRFVLELRDPIDGESLQVAGQSPPLESDLSTPLAYYLNQPELKGQTLSTLGLLKPDSVRELQGLYMLEPYDPNKMPVLMVHGLWSSPVTWMEMFNDLRSDRRVCDNYQFWFYLYPTGQPFWISAAQMRADLAQMRADVDPQHQAAALDQMVLIGHSMGGLVSKLQSVEGGEAFWQINTDRPFTELNADRELRTKLAGAYFFHPNESIRRVITIGTPHRGSPFANDLTRWLARKVIKPSAEIAQGRSTLVSANPQYFHHKSALSIHTSIDSLAPESPLLPALLTATPAPWIEYHNIAGRLPDEGWHGYFGEEGDGVVALTSARLDGAPKVVSQEVVQADHVSVHRHPKSIYEVRRISAPSSWRTWRSCRTAAPFPWRRGPFDWLSGRPPRAPPRPPLRLPYGGRPRRDARAPSRHGDRALPAAVRGPLMSIGRTSRRRASAATRSPHATAARARASPAAHSLRCSPNGRPRPACCRPTPAPWGSPSRPARRASRLLRSPHGSAPRARRGARAPSTAPRCRAAPSCPWSAGR